MALSTLSHQRRAEHLCMTYSSTEGSASSDPSQSSVHNATQVGAREDRETGSADIKMIEAHRCPKCDLRSSMNDEQSWMKVTQKGICTPDCYDRPQLEASCPSIRALMYSQLGQSPGDASALCQRDALVSIQDVFKKSSTAD